MAAPVPVVCCGNVTVGGAGKTTLVLDLARRLSGRGCPHPVARLWRHARGVHRVAPDDPVTLVGDEALLLAQAAPTWTGADRAASAQAAIQAGAKILLMDDGLQNPTLAKTFSILVIDGRTGFGNGRVLPAGPLREPVAAAAARCQAALLIGPDATQALCAPAAGIAGACGPPRPGRSDRRLGRPAGRRLCRNRAHPKNSSTRCARLEPSWSPPGRSPTITSIRIRICKTLLREAQDRDAILVTTPKDAVRLPPAIRARVTVIGVQLIWQEPGQIDQLLERVIADHPAAMS